MKTVYMNSVPGQKDAERAFDEILIIVCCLCLPVVTGVLRIRWCRQGSVKI